MRTNAAATAQSPTAENTFVAADARDSRDHTRTAGRAARAPNDALEASRTHGPQAAEAVPRTRSPEKSQNAKPDVTIRAKAAPAKGSVHGANRGHRAARRRATARYASTPSPAPRPSSVPAAV